MADAASPATRPNPEEAGLTWWFFQIAVSPWLWEAPGMGLTSAFNAAQMRAVIRAGLRRDGDVVTALRLADMYAEDLADARGTTAVVVLLDPDRGTASYASAGHSPPWLLSSRTRRASQRHRRGTSREWGWDRRRYRLRSVNPRIVREATGFFSPVLRPKDPRRSCWQCPVTGRRGVVRDLHRMADGLAEQMSVYDTLCLVAARLRSGPPPGSGGGIGRRDRRGPPRPRGAGSLAD